MNKKMTRNFFFSCNFKKGMPTKRKSTKKRSTKKKRAASHKQERTFRLMDVYTGTKMNTSRVHGTAEGNYHEATGHTPTQAAAKLYNAWVEQHCDTGTRKNKCAAVIGIIEITKSRPEHMDESRWRKRGKRPMRFYEASREKLDEPIEFDTHTIRVKTHLQARRDLNELHQYDHLEE